MVNLRRLLTMLLFMLAVVCVANAQFYERQGNTFVSKSASSIKTPDKQTKFTWKDSKGKDYPVYISAKGSCYIIKTSSKTGKEYKNYLGPEISSQICKELGREYKGKRS